MTRHTPALSFLLTVVVAFAIWYSLKPDPQGNSFRVREMATRVLAEHLARTHPGERALVLSNPFTLMLKSRSVERVVTVLCDLE
jgi:hypothetical protein